MGSPVRPAARPAMEEEEEAIGYLDKVLEDEDDSEPGTPTSPVSPFSAGEKVGSGGTLLPCWAAGVGTRGIVPVMPRCWNSPWGDAVGAGGEQSWGQRQHHCGPSTPQHCLSQGHGAGLCRAPGVEGSEREEHPAALPGGIEPHVPRGGSCVAQQSQHRMLRKGLVLHSAPLLGRQKLPNSPKTELGADWGDPCAGRCSSASFSYPPCQGAWVLQGGSGPALPGVSCMGQPQGPD